MKRLLILAIVAAFPEFAAAVNIYTSSNVAAPICCGAGNVRVINTVSVWDPEPAWANESISHMWLATTFSCSLTYNHFAEVCCIGTGNDRIVINHSNGVLCPIEAKGRSYGWIGPTSTLPYREHESQSFCETPCYCPEEEEDGEDCWWPEDPSCPWYT